MLNADDPRLNFGHEFMEQSNNKFMKPHLFVLRLLELEIQVYMPSYAKT
ncbi:protein of unknown function (plasmid) [Cupriavidus taiwanensis]|uniref:Uncharacterized protein n=1 Tax=Cupriavidus taiwanensis TaxID=164546 RepID=A0A375IW60_9BURK|nr:protein of unknown function [Cupriavidus taiwanensis]